MRLPVAILATVLAGLVAGAELPTACSSPSSEGDCPAAVAEEEEEELGLLALPAKRLRSDSPSWTSPVDQKCGCPGGGKACFIGKVKKAADIDECKEVCADKADCDGFVYKEGKKLKCELFTGFTDASNTTQCPPDAKFKTIFKAPMAPTPAPAPTPPPVWTGPFDVKCDCPTEEKCYMGKLKNPANVQACMAECEGDDDCSGFAYMTKKKGKKECKFFKDIYASDVSDGDQCKEHPKIDTYFWGPPPPPTPAPPPTPPTPAPAPRTWTGPFDVKCECDETGIDDPCNLGKVKKANDIQDCKDKCEDTANCDAFVYKDEPKITCLMLSGDFDPEDSELCPPSSKWDTYLLE